MKTHWISMLTTGAVLLATTGTAGAEATTHKLNSNVASALFLEFADPCVQTTLLVVGAGLIEKISGQPRSSERATSVIYEAINTCTGDVVLGQALGDPETFTMQNVNDASASVTMPLDLQHVDPATGAISVTPIGIAQVTMQWTGVGDVSRSKIVSRVDLAQGFTLLMVRGRARDATVAGSVMLNGQTLFDSSNADDTQAFLAEGTQGELTVVRP
jgi:hypothetical protein